jgi:TonB family protein
VYESLFGGPVDPRLKRSVAVSALVHLTLALLLLFIARSAAPIIEESPPIQVTIVDLKKIPAFKSEPGGGGGGAPAPAPAPKPEAPKAAGPKMAAPKPAPRAKAPKVASRPAPAVPAPVVKTQEPILTPKEISKPKAIVLAPANVPKAPTEIERLARAGTVGTAPEIARGAAASASDIQVDSGGGAGVRGPVGPISVPGGTGTGSGTGSGSGSGSGIGSGSGSGIGAGAGSGVGNGRGDGIGGFETDPDFAEYLQQIQKRIYDIMMAQNQSVTGRQWVRVQFTLDSSARPHNISIQKSSIPALNASALEAMKLASPFPPIPPKFRAIAGKPLLMRVDLTIHGSAP